jgi:leader peptidase (prepilin peptidase)/N-methyltransferase
MLVVIACLSVVVVLALLLALAVIDSKAFLLPNELVLSVLICGIVFNACTVFEFVSPQDMGLGAFIGSAFLYLLRGVSMYFYKCETLGLGDVKLMGAVGAWVGSEYILLAIVIGALGGVLHGLGLALYMKHKAGVFPVMRQLILPAGPGFIAGSIMTAVYVFWDLPQVLIEVWNV